jgi:hypothetical protein
LTSSALASFRRHLLGLVDALVVAAERPLPLLARRLVGVRGERVVELVGTLAARHQIELPRISVDDMNADRRAEPRGGRAARECGSRSTHFCVPWPTRSANPMTSEGSQQVPVLELAGACETSA